MAWIVDRWLAGRWVLLLLALLLAMGSWVLASRLTFDRSVENMFPPDSPILSDYRQLKRTFGGNEIALAVYSDPQLFAADGAGIRRLTKIRQRIASVPGVRAVLSIDQPLRGDAIVSDLPLARRTRALFSGFTHGADGQTVSVVCLLAPPESAPISRRATIDQLRQVLHTLPDDLPDGRLTGEPVLVVDGFRYVEQDGRRLGHWSAFLLGLTILVCFRSFRWVLIPIAVVQLALLATQASLSVFRLRPSMVSSMLTAVVLVVGVATMVHVIVRFRQFRASGLSPEVSLRRTAELLAGPIFWACVTDAVGFLALTVSRVGPVHDFGLMMAIGSLMVLVSVALLVPGLALWGTWDRDPRSPWGAEPLQRRLRGLLQFVRTRPLGLLLAIGLIVAGALAGMGRLEVETDFTKNFRADSEIVRSYAFVERHLGGAGVCDLVIPAPQNLNWDFLDRVGQLSEELNSAGPPLSAAMTKSLSLADVLEVLSPLNLKKQLKLLRDPLVRTALTTVRGQMPEFYETLYGEDPVDGQHYLRLMLRVHERQTAEEKQQLIGQVEQISRRQFPSAR